MAETESVRLIPPQEIRPNPENPRLIFRQAELDALQESIRTQGILVPLTVYRDEAGYVLLDGERRWRCSVKLSLGRIPAIVQPKPERLQNIMMMFAIHNARRDWDPLPTAYKLRELEQEFTQLNGRLPNEVELSELSSLSRGEIRRLRRVIELPTEYQIELMAELEKPRSEQVLTVDQVLEATRGAEALAKRRVITDQEEEALSRAIVEKFQNRVIRNTVAPRQLVRIARAVERQEIPRSAARRVSLKLIHEPMYSIDTAFSQSVEHVDFEHGLEQLVNRVRAKLEEHVSRGYAASDSLAEALRALERAIRQFHDA